MFYDATYLLVILGTVFCLLASGSMKSTYNKFSKIKAKSSLTGREVAEIILQKNNIYGVSVNPTEGSLTDNYNPTNKSVNLSKDIYYGNSLSALGVAAHECGHAIQDSQGYSPLKLRSVFAPVASIGSTMAWPIIIIGIFLGYSQTLINIGILAFSLAVLFQIITLPVEFNASARALNQLTDLNILEDDEIGSAQSVLKAAAFTYIAATASSLLQLLRLVLLFGGHGRREK